jgi:hypothetical protein
VSRRAAVFLYAFAGWTLFVWVVFIRNIAKDHTHTAGFKAVHITLAVISIAFAAGCVAVVRGARQRRDAGAAAHPPVQEGSRHMA